MVNSFRDPSIPAVWLHAQEPDFCERIEQLPTSGPIDAPEPLRLFKRQLQAGHFQELGADTFNQCPMWHDDTSRRSDQARVEPDAGSQFAALPAASHSRRRHLRDRVTRRARRRGAQSRPRSMLPVVPAAVRRQRRRRLSVSIFLPLPISTTSESSLAFMRARLRCSIRTARKFPSPGRYSAI